MKKIIVGLMVGTLITASSIGTLAAPGKPGKPLPGPHPKPGFVQKQAPPQHHHKDWELKSDADYVIKRTATVMKDAQLMARRGQHYSGFALAAAHQQRARELYRSGSYREAISFSLRARDLAFQIISNNHGKVRPEYRMDHREEHYRGGPSGAELDARLDRHKLGKDRDMVHIKIEFNL